MNSYIATFHTHFSAQCTARAMMKAGINAKMAPVPRTLSTDCGTCVRYEAATPLPRRAAAAIKAVLRHTVHLPLSLPRREKSYAADFLLGISRRLCYTVCYT